MSSALRNLLSPTGLRQIATTFRPTIASASSRAASFPSRRTPSTRSFSQSSSSSPSSASKFAKRASVGLAVGVTIAPPLIHSSQQQQQQCDDSISAVNNDVPSNSTPAAPSSYSLPANLKHHFSTFANSISDNSSSATSSPAASSSSDLLSGSGNGANNGSFSQYEPCDFYLDAGVCVIPHPAKRYKGGEDAYFLSEDHRVMGVADGVGGWAEVGVDPSEYSRTLMKGARISADEDPLPRERNPGQIMKDAYAYTSLVKGSSTCCIVVVDGCYLNTANLGDSGFMVIRDNEVAFRSKEQQHSFNFPYQLGTGSTDFPEHSDLFSIPIQEGDLVILGSDGLWDNLYDGQVLDVVRKSHGDPVKTAQMVARHAFRVATDKSALSPFAKSAQEAGYLFTLGGKLDDITVAVGRVTSLKEPPSSSSSSSSPRYNITPDSPSSPYSPASLSDDDDEEDPDVSDDDNDEMDHEPTSPPPTKSNL